MESILLIIIVVLLIALVRVRIRGKMVEAALGGVMLYLEDEGLDFSELGDELKEYYIQKGIEML